MTLLATAVAASPPVIAEQRVIIDSTGQAANDSSINCGLFALIAAATVLEVEVPVAQLFGDPRYLSSEEGSTGDDLRLACKEFGLGAARVSGLSSAELKLGDCPILINLPVRASRQKGGHWMAILGQEDGMLRVYDNLSGMRLKPPAEIDLFWDGTGIAVNTDDDKAASSASALRLRALISRATWAVAPVLLVLVMSCVIRQFVSPFLGEQIGTHPGIVMAASVAAVFASVYMVYPMGSLARHLATRGCTDDLFASETQEDPQSTGQPVRYVRDLSALVDPLVVDVRYSGSYRLGAIPGAINVPINATSDQWVALSDSLFSGRPIVLYCQSAECPWASICQTRLECMGVPALVYAGGYARYRAEHLDSQQQTLGHE